MVEPMIVYWFQNTRRRSVTTFGPVVAPHRGGLARRHGARLPDLAPRSECPERERGGLPPGERRVERREHGEFPYRHDHRTRQCPRKVLAQEPVVDAQGVLTGLAVFAG